MVLFGVCCTPVMALAQHDDYHHDDRNQQYSHHDDRNQQYSHHDEHHQEYVRHREWRRAYHMRHQDWDRGERVDDWRAYHLRQPQRGYEWREVDGNYVMAAVATGVIASIIAASAGH